MEQKPFIENCSVEIMLFREPKRGSVSDSDEATGAHRLIGARPVEHGCGKYFGSVKEKSNRSWGSRGLAPLGASPFGGERGSPSQFPRQLKKLRRNFYRASKISFAFIHFSHTKEMIKGVPLFLEVLLRILLTSNYRDRNFRLINLS